MRMSGVDMLPCTTSRALVPLMLHCPPPTASKHVHASFYPPPALVTIHGTHADRIHPINSNSIRVTASSGHCIATTLYAT